MSETTKNLKLFKYNTTSDANVPFSIDNALNANWDILDENWSKGAGVLPGFLYKVTGLIDESENIFRYANGQVITEDDSVSGLSTFLDKQEKLGADIFCTELEWQNIKTMSKLGQVGKYVRDKKAGTVRLPLILNEQGLTDLANCGLIKDESLPNIKGDVNVSDAWGGTGALSTTGGQGYNPAATRINHTKIEFDASRSSSTYQDGASVQQEAVQYPYVICVNTGVEEAERPINNYQVNNTNSYGDNKYVGNTILNNLSWLRSTGQENSGTISIGFYNWAVANIGQPFGAGLIKESTATDITEYDLVVNQEEQTFILPTLNGSENTMGAKYSAMNITGSPYNFIAPANGWLYMSGTAVSSNSEYVTVYIDEAKTTPIVGRNPLSNASITYLVPVFKGQKVVIEYTASNISRCKFIYAKGNGNLYYYVGDTLQNADLINIARMQEQITDINALSRGYLVESYTNGTSGYRVYSDGFCEQWGLANIETYVTLLKTYRDTNYVILVSATNDSNSKNRAICGTPSGMGANEGKSVNSFGLWRSTYNADGVFSCHWETKGYLADEQY